MSTGTFRKITGARLFGIPLDPAMYGIWWLVDEMTPDIDAAGDPAQQELQMMTSKIGIPILDLLGIAKFTGNLLWYGLERSEPVYQQSAGGGKGSPDEPPPQIVGYKYYMSWAMGLCLGEVDTIYAIYRNDEVVWSGTLNKPVSGGQETITLTDMGSATIYFGTDDQVANSKLTAALDDSTLSSPYRELVYAYFDDCFIGEYNRAPTMKFVMRKSPTCAFDASDTYNDIQVYDYNPMHAIWYILHEMTGLPESWLHNADFLSAAQTLMSELRGISILFNRSQSALSYIEAVAAHIDGIMRYDIDAMFHPKLIRDDYVIGDLQTIDESVLLDDPTLTRKSWIDTLNEVRVQYPELIGVEGGRVTCECGTTVIGYTTQQMAVDEEQELTVENPEDGCIYFWEIASGGGVLSSLTGTSVTYTAPSSNAECSQNATITLKVRGVQCDSLEIAINAAGEGPAAYRTWSNLECQDNAPFPPSCSVDQRQYNCDGTEREADYCFAGRTAGWEIMTCEHCYEVFDIAPCAVGHVSFNDIIALGLLDLRTEVMIEAGCCPAALL